METGGGTRRHSSGTAAVFASAALGDGVMAAALPVRITGMNLPVPIGEDGSRAAPARAESLVVRMQRDRFSPDFEVATVGTTVLWANEEPDPENVHDTYAEDGSWFSPPIQLGESWAFTMTVEGYVRYFCSFHEGMEAALLVVPAEDE